MPAPDSPYAPPASSPVEGGGRGDSRSGSPRPSPFVAGVLSFFFRGVGHVYAGETGRGAAWAATWFAMPLVMGLTGRFARGPVVTVVLVLLVLSFFGLQVVAIFRATGAASKASGTRMPTPLVVVAAVVFVVGHVTIVGLTRAFFVEAFKIPSGSMMPTLLVGDHIFVDKARAGARGDVIVFPYPEHPDQDFVKRIVAAAGDRIEFDDGHPIVNGARLPSCRVGAWSYAEDSMSHDGDLFVESVGGHPYLTFYDHAGGGYGHQGPWTVKPDELFVVGDNRNNAHDSRMWFGGLGGGVPSATVRGVALVVWLSSNDAGVDWSRGGLSLDEPHLPKSAASLAPELAKCLESLRGR